MSAVSCWSADTSHHQCTPGFVELCRAVSKLQTSATALDIISVADTQVSTCRGFHHLQDLCNEIRSIRILAENGAGLFPNLSAINDPETERILLLIMSIYSCIREMQAWLDGFRYSSGGGGVDTPIPNDQGYRIYRQILGKHRVALANAVNLLQLCVF
jgi:hypothetical protein